MVGHRFVFPLQLFESRSYFIAFAIVFLALISCSYFISFVSIENDTNSTLHKSLRSQSFAEATLISVGVSIPLLLHLGFETLASIRVPNCHLLSRWSNLLAYSMTNYALWITLRLDCIDGKIYFMVLLMMCSVFVFGHVGSLSALCPDVWNYLRGFIFTALVSLFFAFSYQDQHFLNINTSYGILAFLCYVLAALLFVHTSYTWYKRYLYKKKWKELRPNEKICLARMSSLAIAFLVVVIIFLLYGKHRFEDYGVTFITTFSYAISANAIAYVMSYLKKLHYEAAEVSVRNS